MLNTLFSLSVAKAINNNAAKTKRLLEYECDNKLTDPPSPTFTFTAGQSYCFQAKSFFIVGSNDVTISRISAEGEESDPVSNALGATSPLDTNPNKLSETMYKIVIPADADVENLKIILHDFNVGRNEKIDGGTFITEYKSYIALKRSITETISSEFEKVWDHEYNKFVLISKRILELFFFNPNTASITSNNAETTYFNNVQYSGPIDDKSFGTLFAKSPNIPDEFEYEFMPSGAGKYTATAKVIIQGNPGSLILPGKFFEIIPNTIYTINTPDADIVDFVTGSDACDYFYHNVPNNPIQLTGGLSYCLRTDGFFLVGSENIDLSNMTDEWAIVSTSSKALGAVSSKGETSLNQANYKLSSTNDQTIQLYHISSYSKSESSGKFSWETREYLSLKKDTTETISYKIHKEDGTFVIQSTKLHFLNPNSLNISFVNDKDTKTLNNDREIVSDVENVNKGEISVSTTLDVYGFEKGTIIASSLITIKGNTGSISLPGKLFELTPDTIYTINTSNADIVVFLPPPATPAATPEATLAATPEVTPAATSEATPAATPEATPAATPEATPAEGDPENQGSDSETTDGLGGGSIAAIVIVCTIVVAVAAFCVYWFIFHNKSDASNSESASAKNDRATSV
jgi:uncharacterized protein YneR